MVEGDYRVERKDHNNLSQPKKIQISELQLLLSIKLLRRVLWARKKHDRTPRPASRNWFLVGLLDWLDRRIDSSPDPEYILLQTSRQHASMLLVWEESTQKWVLSVVTNFQVGILYFCSTTVSIQILFNVNFTENFIYLRVHFFLSEHKNRKTIQTATPVPYYIGRLLPYTFVLHTHTNTLACWCSVYVSLFTSSRPAT